MTSGNFKSVAVSSITVDRENRQRRALTNIPELAESIRRNGLIHPLVVDEDHNLIAGERRLTAIQSLGWTHVPVQYTSELDELETQLIELEENIRRENIQWDDECRAVDRYHRLRVSQEPEQTIEATAAELGQVPTGISKKLQVAKELARGNELVKNADKLSTAINITQREASRRLANVGLATPSIAKALTGSTEIIPERKAPPLINVDFIEYADSYTERPFNFLHCDFPYGVKMHKSGQGANKEFGSYDDDEDVYWRLLDCLERNMNNLVAPSAHLMFWFSMDFYHETTQRLTNMGWRVNPFPLIWFKSDNTGIIPDAQRGPRRVYETCLFASRDDRLLSARGAVSNLFAAPGREKEIHMNEKPEAMLRHFMNMIVDEHTFMLDPTCGSGNACKAAQSLGAGLVLGIEKDPEFFARSVDMYYSE